MVDILTQTPQDPLWFSQESVSDFLDVVLRNAAHVKLGRSNRRLERGAQTGRLAVSDHLLRCLGKERSLLRVLLD